MRISRRQFAYGMAGIAVSASAAQPSAILERRVYAPGSTLPALEALHRHGIRPESVKRSAAGTAYVIRFASLEARARAWDRFNTDDSWCAIRDRGNVALQEVQVYPGGKILEMSL